MDDQSVEFGVSLGMTVLAFVWAYVQIWRARGAHGIDLLEQRRQIDAEREAAHEAERKAAELTVDLVRKLNADHVPLRDIGEAVGVSFQRVHQLLNA